MGNYKLKREIDFLVAKGWKYLGNGNFKKEDREINLDIIEDEGKTAYLVVEDGRYRIYDYLTNL